MIPSELRKKARKALEGNWGKAILIGLAYFFFVLILNTLERIFFKTPSLSLSYSVIELLILVPLAFGLAFTFLKLKRNEFTTTFDFITEGFSRFSKVWTITLWVIVKMLLPICCFIMAIILFSVLLALQVKLLYVVIIAIIAYIACIVYAISRGLLYSMVYYIAYDNPELSGKEVVKKSEELMRGNRGNLFLLELSFIGWIFLGFLTLGIGLIWVVPYLQVTVACFYDELTKSNVKEVEGTAKVEEIVKE